MAVSAIAKQSEDKIMRQAYQRRKDDIYFHKLELAKGEQDRKRAEKAEAEIAKLRREIEMLRAGKTP